MSIKRGGVEGRSTCKIIHATKLYLIDREFPSASIQPSGMTRVRGDGRYLDRAIAETFDVTCSPR